MEPAMAQFESKYKNKVNIVSINIDDEDTPEQKKYAKAATSEYIPFTVWLDSKGKPIDEQVGSMTLLQLSQRTEAAIKKAR